MISGDVVEITPRYLINATGCLPVDAEKVALPLKVAAARWGIDTPTRVASFVGQSAFETRLFTKFEEELYYKTPARLISVWPSRFRLPVNDREDTLERFHDGKRNARLFIKNPERLAEFTYGGRFGNGKEGSGDGWKFRGRGFFHLTFFDNYSAYCQASGFNVVDDPELLASDMYVAADSAGWFWKTKGINFFADRLDWEGMTKRIQGGHQDHDRREALVKQSIHAFLLELNNNV